MRRNDREITAAEEKLAILGECKVCRLAMIAGGAPYIVPLNFGWEYAAGHLTLYFHGAKEGRKIAALRENPEACFEADCGGRLVEADAACGYGFLYRSVIGYGRVAFLESAEEKARGLASLMKHQTGRDGWTFPRGALDAVAVFALAVTEFTGKEKKQ